VAHLLGQWLAAPLAVASLLTGVLLFVLVPGLGRAAQAATATPPHVTHTQRLLYTIAPAAAAILLAVTLARYGQGTARHAPARRARTAWGGQGHGCRRVPRTFSGSLRANVEPVAQMERCGVGGIKRDERRGALVFT